MLFTNTLLLSFALSATAAEFQGRQKTGPFQLYAYGDNIGGLPLVSMGEQVLVGHPKTMKNPQAAPIIFAADKNGTWQGSPNKTVSSGATWGNLTFSLPGSASSSRQVMLLNTANGTEARVNNGFGFWGSVAFLFPSDGTLQSHWTAIPSTGSGVWSCEWNRNGTNSSPKAALLTLKLTPPSIDP
ncbi:hypothetical protein GQ44DRAFT_779616 [Phaeosphaeriaceae sp. PMI808]|nr:hypothetical protein GQ44DRAFT_779616 [Phaeosphaeriaceae sp. PMI808]